MCFVKCELAIEIVIVIVIAIAFAFDLNALHAPKELIGGFVDFIGKSMLRSDRNNRWLEKPVRNGCEHIYLRLAFSIKGQILWLGSNQFSENIPKKFKTKNQQIYLRKHTKWLD